MKNLEILNGAWLKRIAMMSMLLDHFDKGILTNLIIIKGVSNPWINILSNVFAVLGRIAFPIFLFLLTEGFFYTKDRKKYFFSLLGFGVLAEIPYDMFESGVYWDNGGQNMYFTLALALLTLCMIDWIKNKIQKKWWIVATIPVILLCSFLSAYLGLDYTYYGILIPVIFYFLKEHRVAGSFLSYAVILKELWSILGFGILNLYNGERGKINKWFCYWFYPAHLLIIGFIRIYVMKC